MGVAGAQLPQYGDQRVADQRVDLVHQQHQRRGVRQRPARKHLPQHAGRSGALQQAGPQARRQRVIEGRLRLDLQFAEDGAHRLRLVFARRLARLDVHVDAAVLAVRAAVEQVAQRQQGRGLAGLTRCVQHEVAFVPNQREQIIDIQPTQRRHAIVFLRLHRSSRVEEAHRSHQVSPFPRACQIGRLGQAQRLARSIRGRFLWCRQALTRASARQFEADVDADRPADGRSGPSGFSSHP